MDLQKVGINCLNGGSATQGVDNKCNTQGSCGSNPATTPTPTPSTAPGGGNGTGNGTGSNPADIFGCNKDKVCDVVKENCLSCPSDCLQCKVDGFVLKSFDGCIVGMTNCTYSQIELIEYPSVINFMPDKSCPVSGIISSYFDVPRNGYYTFRATASNMGVKLLVDDGIVINSFFTQTTVNSSRSIRLSSNHPHRFELVFFSISSDVRNVSLDWDVRGQQHSDGDFNEIDGYYNRNICGDDIFDAEEGVVGSPYYCDKDRSSYPSNSSAVCGDKICNETPESCIVDCYMIISPQCPGQSQPSVQGISTSEKDTIGSLLANQYLFTLPGVHLLRHGMDLLTGKQKPSPLFQFQYCDNTSFSIVQDFNRDIVYAVPKELYASISPQCTYESTTTEYSSYISIQNEKVSETGLDFGGSAGIGNTYLTLMAELAYSKDETVEKAKELESRIAGRIFKTQVDCISSKISLVKHTFSEEFLKDLSKVEKYQDAIPIVLNYGNLYIEQAEMGGRLSQLTVVKEQYGANMESTALTKHVELSFGTSLRTPYFSAGYSKGETMDSDIKTEVQSTFESESERTTVITKGGPPGAFSPSKDSSDYQTWASKVDLIPVPINYKVGFVYDIIPDMWTTTSGEYYLKDLFLDAELNWLYGINPNPHIPISKNQSIVKIQFLNYTPLKNKPLTINVTDEKGSTYGADFNNVSSPVTITMPLIQGGIMNVSTSVSNLDYIVSVIASNRAYYYKQNVVQYVRGQILLLFNNFKVQPTYGGYFSKQFLQISIVGSRETKVKNINLWEIMLSSSLKIEVETDDYIGQIISVSLYLWDTNTRIANGFSFDNVTILQSCSKFIEEGDISGCTPKSPSSQGLYTYHFQSVGPSVNVGVGVTSVSRVIQVRSF